MKKNLFSKHIPYVVEVELKLKDSCKIVYANPNQNGWELTIDGEKRRCVTQTICYVCESLQEAIHSFNEEELISVKITQIFDPIDLLNE